MVIIPRWHATARCRVMRYQHIFCSVRRIRITNQAIDYFQISRRDTCTCVDENYYLSSLSMKIYQTFLWWDTALYIRWVAISRMLVALKLLQDYSERTEKMLFCYYVVTCNPLYFKASLTHKWRVPYGIADKPHIEWSSEFSLLHLNLPVWGLIPQAIPAGVQNNGSHS